MCIAIAGVAMAILAHMLVHRAPCGERIACGRHHIMSVFDHIIYFYSGMGRELGAGEQSSVLCAGAVCSRGKGRLSCSPYVRLRLYTTILRYSPTLRTTRPFRQYMNGQILTTENGRSWPAAITVSRGLKTVSVSQS